MNFKKALLALVLAVVFSAGSALAQNSNNSNAGNQNAGNVENSEQAKNKGAEKNLEAKNEIKSRFCENFNSLVEKLENKIQERKSAMLQNREQRLSQWEENTAEREMKIDERRILRNQNLEKHFARLEERAQTETQKNAVNDFQETVRNAIEARRKAVDLAIESFRNGVSKLHEQRKNYLDPKTEAFISLEQGAVKKAQAECANSGNDISIRQTLKNSLKQAKNNFSAEKNNAGEIQTQMKALIRAKKQAIEKANANFKAAVAKAKTDLKPDFPSTGS